MRLFLAVELEPPVVRAAADLVAQLQTRASSLAPRARLTWATPGRMHITVAFLGEVEARRADGLIAQLQEPLRAAPFVARLRGLGAFPVAGPPRVFWCGIDEGRDELVASAAMMSSRLAELGWPPEARGYHPHLTLARVREAAGLRAATLFEGLRDAVLGATGVEAITLFESRLSPKGPTYVALAHTPLAAR